MNLKKQFGLNVQKYRKLKKLTQERLAELVGIDPTSISSIETGKYFVSAENLLKLSEALNVEIADLFTFNETFSNEKTYNEILEILSYLKEDSIRLKAVKNYIKSLI